ncbi:synaptic vesicular amine transporter-like protein [Leptotrombidium deliense]|uniref:Synaptic vesicular amine transporter-like protein n=1 Tax=Leptotrombidium deliense TaxID=299467 RepID=A0A443SNU8_9ACAR|nr:synaptic vesicular amine transporter-like protein [Leptotrombidium deliense]
MNKFVSWQPVPIIPGFLFEIHHQKNMAKLNESLMESAASASNDVNSNVKIETPLLLKDAIEKQSNQKAKFDNSGESECRCNEMETTTETTTELITQKPVPSISLEEKIRHQELLNENLEVGVLFASKPIVQAIANPFIGMLTNSVIDTFQCMQSSHNIWSIFLLFTYNRFLIDYSNATLFCLSRIGFTIPMFSGFVILFLSTLTFAVGKSFPTLFLARSMQGIGSACTSVAGMGMLAKRYPDDRERGNALAIALGGLALGVLIGPPFGGLIVLKPKVLKEDLEATPLKELIRDPYIIIAAGTITVANLGIGILEPSLPLYMMDIMHSSKWEQGAAFLPASISYLIGTNIFGPLGYRMGRWLASFVALIMIAFSLLFITMAMSFHQLIVPMAVIGFAIVVNHELCAGMVDSSIMPMLGYLVDIRHTAVYGGIYAIGDVAFCLGFIGGPSLSSTIGKWFGFQWLAITTAVICFIYSPMMFLLRKPPARNEDQLLLHESTVRYVNYTNEETPEEDNDCKKLSDQTMLP